MIHSFGKAEKLKRKKHIQEAFLYGKSITHFPIKLIYAPIADEAVHKCGVSVPKRNFKKAVDRNRIKRQMREAYRLNKDQIENTDQHYALMFIFISRKKEEYADIYDSIQEILKVFNKKIK